MKQTGTSQSVLVLGASGKIGTMLASHWAMSPANGWHFDWQVRGHAKVGQVRWQPGDDPAILPRVDAILALWGVSTGRENPDYHANSNLGIQALEIAQTVGASRVLLASSAAVYGPTSAVPFREDLDPIQPPSDYGESKLAMEKATEEWAQTHANAPALVNLRVSNVIGADSLFAALNRSPNIMLDRFASGAGPRRSYITAPDFARVVEVLLNLPPAKLPRVLNVAGTRPLAMQDLIQAAGGNITWQTAPESATEAVILDTKRLEAITGPLAESADACAAIASLNRLRGRT